MKKISFIKEKCVGCKSCMLACSIKHHEDFSWKQARLKIEKNKDEYSLSVCIQCQHKNCFKICPKNAIEDIGGGILKVDWDLCIGCGLCVDACEYNGIWIASRVDKALKCDLCEGKPACVEACIAGALVLEDISGGD
jgi:Fe-S-cluster-containing hydrogenase component 2